MQKRRQFHRVWRGLWYMVGLVVLAFGITMNIVLHEGFRFFYIVEHNGTHIKLIHATTSLIHSNFISILPKEFPRRQIFYIAAKHHSENTAALPYRRGKSKDQTPDYFFCDGSI